MNVLKKIPLLGWIVVAIILGILLGPVMPDGLGSVFMTYNSIFSGFLSFIVPLIILGLVMPAIAELGKGAGKWLGVTALIAYGSTVLAGLLAYFVSRWLFTASLTGGGVEEIGEGEGSGFEPFVSLVTSAGDGATEIVLETSHWCDERTDSGLRNRHWPHRVPQHRAIPWSGRVPHHHRNGHPPHHRASVATVHLRHLP